MKTLLSNRIVSVLRLIVIALWLSPLSALNAADPVKPNIVFIYADDWGWGDLSCHGNTWLQTPHIDRMAEEGIDFQRFNVLSPVCSPSRVAALTGHFPARYGINHVFGGVKNPEMPHWLDGRAPTIPRALKTVGYRTGHFGKWHLGSGPPTMADYGIDESAVYGGPGPQVSKSGDEIADLSVKFIEDNKDRPFYLNVWLHESHLDHTPSAESLEQWKHLDERQQVYAAVISDGDNKVGRTLDALDRAGIADHTLVVFSSDNGPMEANEQKGKPGAWRGYYSIGETAGLRGHKHSLYEGGVRVPFIVRWPGHTPRNVINDTTVVTAVDLLPTFCAAAGVTLPAATKPDGENLLAAFEGKPITRTRPLFWVYRGNDSKGGPDYWAPLAVRDGDWKLLSSYDGQRVELFNLNDDRIEAPAKDVSGQHPELTQRLTKRVLDWWATMPKKPDPTTIGKKPPKRGDD